MFPLSTFLNLSAHLNPAEVQILNIGVLLEGLEEITDQIDGNLHPGNIQFFDSYAVYILDVLD